ncbi:MAG: hypothetical protein ACE5J3_09405 [Methanosarcinales archaeon]
MKDFEGGKELENKVKEILTQNNFSFKQEPNLTDFSLRADFLVLLENGDTIIEVSQRNSNEDIQKLYLRSLIYRNNSFKTLVIIPEPHLTSRSLRKFQFLLHFSDMFLFTKDLHLLPTFLNDMTSGAFLKYISTKLSTIYPEVLKILEFLGAQGRIPCTFREISKGTGIPASRIRSLLYGLRFNLTRIGVLKSYGSSYCLDERFLKTLKKT